MYTDYGNVSRKQLKAIEKNTSTAHMRLPEDTETTAHAKK
jgi:hypothetical protein